MMIDRKLIGITEVAEHLGVEKSTIYGWVHTREIPYYKVGRLVKFKPEEIEQWLVQRKVHMIDYN